MVRGGVAYSRRLSVFSAIKLERVSETRAAAERRLNYHNLIILYIPETSPDVSGPYLRAPIQCIENQIDSVRSFRF